MHIVDSIAHADRRCAPQRRRAHLVSGGFALLATALLAACAPDPVRPVSTLDPTQLFWALRLDHRAVTLSMYAPYDTLRLTATPLLVSGAPLSDAPVPVFRSTDVDRVQVDSTGLLHAIKVGRRIAVIAQATVDDIVHSDTVWVNVVDAAAPPELAALSIDPIPPDSAKYALGGSVSDIIFGEPKVLAARVTDVNGDDVPTDSLVVSYESTDTMVATIDAQGIVTPHRVGPVTFIATATAYGVTKADTLPYTIGLPLLVGINVQVRVDAHGDTVPVFPPAPTVIGVGGDVAWDNESDLLVDVTFDDPTNAQQDDVLCALLGSIRPEACQAGDIAAWSITNGSSRLRQFRVPGTYHYHDSRTGTSGTIIVQDE